MAWLSERPVATTEAWESLSPGGKQRAWFITGMGEEDTAAMAVAAQHTFRTGRGTAHFRASAERLGLVVPDTQEPGPGQVSRWHANLIYDQNMTTMFAADRWLKAQEGAADRPYGEYLAVLDSETRPEHAALDGIIKPLDDPFWDKYWPPWEFNCRCEVVTVSDDDLEAELLSLTEGVPAGVEPNPEWVFSRHDAFRMRDEAPTSEAGIKDAAVLQGLKRPQDHLTGPQLLAIEGAVEGVDVEPEPPVAPTELPLAQAEEQADAQVRELLNAATVGAEAFLPKLNEVWAEERRLRRELKVLADSALGPELPLAQQVAEFRKSQELVKEKKKVEARRKRLLKQRGQVWAAEHAVDNPQTMSITFGDTGRSRFSKAQQKRVTGTVQELGSITELTDSWPGTVGVFRIRRRRAFYTKPNGSINIGASSSRTSIMHELGHRIEHASPHVHRRCREFLSKRTVGEEPEWLGDTYGLHEVSRKDKFLSPYTGRTYPGSDATEILSMGLQELAVDPVAFAENDYDHYRFTVGVLRGWI